MDWFERLTGFREADYDSTRSRLAVEGETLVSLVDGQRHGIGRLELATLADLRRRTGALAPSSRRTTLRCVSGDAKALHLQASNAGALFQVASQFNLLEMVSPRVTPEHGVTGYAEDPTQGPACAVSAGAATIWRNYFAPVNGVPGQTSERQLDALAPLGQALAARLGRPAGSLWTMRNGYALASADGLAAIGALLRGSTPAALDELRAALAIGLHHDVEVTAAPGPQRPRVTQAFCSALPVAYSQLPAPRWQPFARLVLEAAYEATLLAAVERHHRHGAPARVLLTRLGGGAFGNDDRWIDDALARALRIVEWSGLDVQLVSFGAVHPAHAALAARWREGA